MSSPPHNNFTGSCHCGQIKYTITLPPSLLTTPVATRCNCTFCQKPGFTSLFIPQDTFTLLSPSTKSELSDYQANNNPNIHRYFCAKCGVHVFREGTFEVDGEVSGFFTVNLVTLDTPQEGLDFGEWRFEYLDGKYDVLREHGRKETPWKDGVL